MSDELEATSLSERTLSSICHGGMVIDAIVLAKVMDEDGDVTIHHHRSADSNIFEVIGMLTVYLDSLRQHCQGTDEDDEWDEAA